MTTARDFGDIVDLAIGALVSGCASAKHVEPYAGQVEEAIEGRLKQMPLLTVGYTGTDFAEVDGENFDEVNEYEVGIFNHSLAGKAALRALSEQGIREVKAALVNVTLATNVSPVKPLRVRLAFSNESTQIYAFGFSVALDKEYAQ